MRGFSAARPLGVEVEGSATENLAQPVPPRNIEDPWEIKKLGYDRCILPISIPTLYQCHPEPTGLSSLVFGTFPEYVIRSHIQSLEFFNYPHPYPNTPVIQQQQALVQQCVHLLSYSKHIPESQLGLKLLPVLERSKWSEVQGLQGGQLAGLLWAMGLEVW